jgi:hypothetical protein
VWILLVALIASNFLVLLGSNIGNVSNSQSDKQEMRYVQHGVIYIDSDADFANKASTEGWPGDGSKANPYVIQNYYINATGSEFGVYIGNVTYYFNITGNYIYNGSKANILIFNSTHFTVSYNRFSREDTLWSEGLYVDNNYWTATNTKSEILVLNNSFEYSGCYIRDAINSTIKNNTLYESITFVDTNNGAIEIKNSTNIRIENNAMKDEIDKPVGIVIEDSTNVTAYYNYIDGYAK